MKADRRTFLKSLAAVTAGLTAGCGVPGSKTETDRLGDVLPRRKFGRTGEYVTMLGTGGFHVGWTTEKDAQEIIETALEGGVRFFDTAESYSKGLSEERYGKFLTPKYRDLIFLMSKTTGPDAKTVREHLEGSLRRLKVDQIDLFQVHSVRTPQDVDDRIQNGVLDVMMKAKEEGKIKYIGFTGHQNPFAHAHMLDRTSESDIFDGVLMPVNVLDQVYFSFTKNVIPKALDRNLGIMSIKSLADGRFFAKKEQARWTTDDPVIPNYLSVEEAMHFVWSLPVSVLITGSETAEMMREKIDLARSFTKLSEDQKITLVEKVRDIAMAGKVEYYKRQEA
ncbi:MAG: aldo/keto reductase [Prolixibacteraceae bacterium]|jgi:aryl-alcohol dehydrogenase-like predicted oxidoreductase|nr:aldo/keto reductase [Prolixibacteraceae bacterium]MDD4756918.1 aldo/keto reductase [Prolixibacteraceae bacterium]NLO01766.1 aldo/keto reductase [Bacteroidales bacterium]